jgi:hypothetical protein
MSFVTDNFPNIWESESAEYAYLADVYNTTYSHNQNVWGLPDENKIDGVMYAAWLLLDEYYTRGEYAMIVECRHLLTKRCRAELHSEHNREFCTGFYTVVDSVLSI